jgi:heterodisulfide reductase subunit C
VGAGGEIPLDAGGPAPARQAQARFVPANWGPALRKMKFQREAEPQWARQVSERPGCEGLFSCLQCGACSGTCPLSIYMDFAPRRVIALVREGFRQDALSCQTIWLCASCYSCAVHCPRQIHITDVMYSLKREAIQEKLYPKHLAIPVLAQEFYSIVRRNGRSSEFWLVLRMALRTNPWQLFGMFRTGWQLIRTGRLSLRRERIERRQELESELGTREVA